MKQEKVFCPYCKEELDLENDSIGFSEKGEMLFKVNRQNGDLNFEHDEFLGNTTGGKFFCRYCGHYLPKTTLKKLGIKFGKEVNKNGI